jgi:mannose-1-phosphate guanylyltransferase
MFIWRTTVIEDDFRAYLPEVAEIFEEGRQHYYKKSESDFIRRSYPSCRNISIDYAIMEKAANVYVVLGDFGWSDLGSWESVYEHHPNDQERNVILGKALAVRSSDCLIAAPEGKLVVVEGQHNLLVLDYDDVLLITQRGSGAKIKEIMGEVRSATGEKFL